MTKSEILKAKTNDVFFLGEKWEGKKKETIT